MRRYALRLLESLVALALALSGSLAALIWFLALFVVVEILVHWNPIGHRLFQGGIGRRRWMGMLVFGVVGFVVFPGAYPLLKREYEKDQQAKQEESETAKRLEEQGQQIRTQQETIGDLRKDISRLESEKAWLAVSAT
jgi:hypothetical protein